MPKKNRPDAQGYVYSTDPDFEYRKEETTPQTLDPKQQKLRVRLDSKQRGGKVVTLIQGFTGSGADLEDLGKRLKNYCGTGGSAKDGDIIVQGDQRDKVIQWLLKNGYNNSKKSG
jgi:translation initiation factor 1